MRKKPDPQESFLTIAAVSERLQVSQKTVRRWVNRGDLVIHRFGRSIRVRPTDLETFVKCRRGLLIRLFGLFVVAGATHQDAFLCRLSACLISDRIGPDRHMVLSTSCRMQNACLKLQRRS